MKINILKLLLILSLCSACSFAPLSSPKTARSLGKGNWQVAGGVTPAPGFDFSRGMSENFDLGISLEQQLFPVVGLWGRYSILNSNANYSSVAISLGASQALDAASSTGIYGGPIYSYKQEWFEFYISARFNWVRWEGYEFTSEEESDFFVDLISWDDEDFTYMQYVLGVNFWFYSYFALNINAKVLDMLGDEASGKSTSNILPSINILWKY